MAPGWIALIVILGVLLIGFVLLVPFGIWFRALVSGAPVSIPRLIGMRLRRVKVAMIVDAYITGKKAGLDIDIATLETHYMAKGDVINVVNALISAHSAKIDLDIRTAMAIDLAGRDVLNAVKVSVNLIQNRSFSIRRPSIFSLR